MRPCCNVWFVFPLRPRHAIRSLAHATWMQLLDSRNLTLTTAAEAHHIMSGLASKCAAIVDEVRKTLAVVDMEGANIADWGTLQAEEVSSRYFHRQSTAHFPAVNRRNSTWFPTTVSSRFLFCSLPRLA